MSQTAYQVAKGWSGVQEGNAKLDDFLNNGGANLSATDYAWCARFVKQAAANAGVDVSKMTDMARSALAIGTPTDKPNVGDLAVLSRTSDTSKGHVGFFEGFNPDGSIKVLSGNHADQVASGNYPKERLLGFRALTPAQDPRNVAMNGGQFGVDPDGFAGVASPLQTAVPVDAGVVSPQQAQPVTMLAGKKDPLAGDVAQGMLSSLFNSQGFKSVMSGDDAAAAIPKSPLPGDSPMLRQSVNVSQLLSILKNRSNLGTA